MDQSPLSPGPHYVSLFCEKLNIEIEFNLNPGTFVRFGSAEDMEVVLPFAGVGPQELRLDRDASGNLIAASANGVRVITGEVDLPLGPHLFTLRTGKKQPPPVPVKSAPPPPPSAPAVFERRQPLPPPRSRPARRKIAGWALGVIGGLAFAIPWAFAFLGKRDGERHAPPPAEKQTLQAGLVREPDPAPAPKPTPLPPEPAPVAPPPPPPAPDLAEAPPPPAPEKPAAATREVVNWKTIASQVKDSVYLLKVRGKDGEFAQGTAFRIKPEGFLVTNAHVIKGGSAFEAISEKGDTLKTTRVRHYDEERDLAVLEFHTPSDSPGLKLSDAEKPNVGEPVGVYGNPQGMRGTFSEGTLSAFRQAAEVDRPKMGELIQITAPISQGSSGSPVLNTDGEVIGIATLLLKSGQNINFAIPVSELVKILREEPLPPWEFVSRGSGRPESIPELRSPETSPRERLSPDDFEELKRSYRELREDLLARNWIPALRMARKLAARNPDDFLAQMGVGLASHGLSKYADAEIALSRAVELDPLNWVCREYLVRTRVFLKKWNEASLDLLALGELELSVAESLLRSARLAFGDDLPGLNRMARVFEARFPPESPESRGTRLVSAFLRAAEGPDVDREIRTYDDVVELYYKDDVKAESREVLEDLKQFRRKWPTRKYYLDKVETCKFIERGAGLLVRYSYRYTLSGTGGKRSGVVRQEIVFSENYDRGEWVVIGIRALNRKGD